VKISARISNGVAVLDVSGRLTANDHPGLIRDAVADAARQGGSVIVLNLAAVQYLDSTRLGELIAAHVTLSRDGRRLALVSAPERVRELLQLAGLDSVFELFDSVELAAAGGGRGAKRYDA
jgi:anti-sigma B factor antagonist